MVLDQATKLNLVKQANEVRRFAYAPYSKYPVGAALLTSTGKIYTGVNIENIDFTDGICAERTAIFKAISEGERSFEAIAVVTNNGGTPCGSCRQVMAEFNLKMIVIMGSADGEILSEMTVEDLLPAAFDPGNYRLP
ncbi:cytidine deaminase [Leptolinea tardivitalis]|uniref:Cytidine deaminase n=1 Tax=Leptolinea tardivitalis TaxID=229920 RepID=A0A0P6X6P9_9CHLR|nr:cytidine deaminase [Leptolinea tardivitalis]KPL70607.1 cytidine deaminase [Leptolinea tardivitalis]GAP22222.1 cytidine deaminase [Leptolinea tardivitalis]